MFDSLKKKFAEASGKLRNKVEEDAKNEDNIELIGEDIDNSQEDTSDTQENVSVDDSEGNGDILNQLGLDEDDLKDINEDSEDIDDEIDDEVIDEENSEEVDEEFEERKSGFLSFFKRNKSKDSNSNEDPSDDYSEEDLSDAFDDFSVTLNRDSEDISEEISIEEKVEDDSQSEENVESDEDNSKSSVSSFFKRSKKEDSDDDVEGKGGFLSFIREKTISESDVEDILFELELGLLEADVAMEVSSTIVESLKEDLVGKKIKRSSDIDQYVFNALKDVVSDIIDIGGPSMTEMLESKVAEGEPLVVMLIGINGTGKTTTIGKLCNFYLKKGYTPVIAASDTFRAGAIEQIGHHADNLGVKLIKHEKGSDPAAVAFDAVQHAKAKGKEIVFIDTAGRMQTNVNLMDEMKKIRRVSKPDLVVFVGDSLTGNDATEQARKFKESIDIDGVILTKADADSKGGASLSIGYVVKKPILFLGMGQSYDDIREYDADWMLEQIFS